MVKPKVQLFWHHSTKRQYEELLCINYVTGVTCNMTRGRSIFPSTVSAQDMDQSGSAHNRLIGFTSSKINFANETPNHSSTPFFFYKQQEAEDRPTLKHEYRKIMRSGQWDHFKMIVLIPNSIFNTFLSGRVRYLFRKFDFC